jgi:hypothetical protein
MNLMSFKKYRPIFEIVLCTAPLYFIHKIYLYYTIRNGKQQEFNVDLEIIYAFFFTFLLILIAILIKIVKKNIDYVGYAFIIVTTLKLGFCYLFFSSILNSESLHVTSQKLHFFFIFGLFSTIETIVTSKMLNRRN